VGAIGVPRACRRLPFRRSAGVSSPLAGAVLVLVARFLAEDPSPLRTGCEVEVRPSPLCAGAVAVPAAAVRSCFVRRHRPSVLGPPLSPVALRCAARARGFLSYRARLLRAAARSGRSAGRRTAAPRWGRRMVAVSAALRARRTAERDVTAGAFVRLPFAAPRGRAGARPLAACRGVWTVRRPLGSITAPTARRRPSYGRRRAFTAPARGSTGVTRSLYAPPAAGCTAEAPGRAVLSPSIAAPPVRSPPRSPYPRRRRTARAIPPGAPYRPLAVSRRRTFAALPGLLPARPAAAAPRGQRAAPPPLTTAPALLASLITECLFRAPQGRPAAGNVLERLSRIPATSLTGGLAALAEANRAEAARRSEADRQASAHATEAERREDLLEAARMSLLLISEQLLTTITSIVSTAEVQRGAAEGWTVRLASAALTFSGATAVTAPWSGPFDVVAHAVIQLKIPQDRYGYEGRSHSLWYADAQTAERYQWFETAFMETPLRGGMSSMDPFALKPDSDANTALRPVIGLRQVAWRFTPLSTGGLDGFIDRWTGWLAQAASGQLRHPMQMPEHNPEGSWRK
jgi:serine/threonine-protein kinase